MSDFLDSRDEIKPTGTLQICPSAIDTMDFHITWNVCGKFRLSYVEQSLTSPIFTIPGSEKCQWYIHLQSEYARLYATDRRQIVLSIRLILHPESDCKAAIAEFDLYVENGGNLDAKYTRIFKFVTKDYNACSILSLMEPNSLQYHYDSDNPEDQLYFHVSDDDGDDDRDYNTTIVGNISIKTVFPEYDNFPKAFESLLKNQQCTDVVLSVGKKRYPAHKAILIARSSVFAAMFAHNMMESQGVVRIEDTEEDVIEEMLRFIYTGEVEKLTELAQDLFVAADKYDLQGLRYKCEETLIKNLSDSNAIQLLLFAQLYNAKELKFKAIDLIKRGMKNLQKTPEWKNLNPDLVQEINSHVIAKLMYYP